MFTNIFITTTSILVVANWNTPPTTSILVAGSQRVKEVIETLGLQKEMVMCSKG